MKTFLVCLSGFLCLWCGVQGTPALCTKAAQERRQQQCYERNGVTMEGDGVHDVQSVANSDSAGDVCAARIDSYSSAITCAYDVAKDCLRSEGVSTTILSDADKVIEGLKFVCRHGEDLNYSCYKFVKPGIVRCATRRLLLGIDNWLTATVEEVTCASWKAIYECTKDYMWICGRRSMQLHLAFTNEYLRPPACEHFDPEANDYPASTGEHSGQP